MEEEQRKSLIKDAEECIKKNEEDQTHIIVNISWGALAIFLAMNIELLAKLSLFLRILLSILLFLFTISIVCEFLACYYAKNASRIAQQIISGSSQHRDKYDKYEKYTERCSDFRDRSFIFGIIILGLFLILFLFL